jgi:hypothetical protein
MLQVLQIKLCYTVLWYDILGHYRAGSAVGLVLPYKRYVIARIVQRLSHSAVELRSGAVA